MSAEQKPVRWKVVPCPVNAGRHPYHDQRWIMTADAEVEMCEPNDWPGEWRLNRGTLVCQLRDVRPGTGALLAAAPELLEALDGIMKWWMQTDEFQNGEDSMPADLFDDARHAIAKAEGRS